MRGLVETGYLTSDEVLRLTSLPASVAVIGGGYIAAELGHFLAAMGSKVTIMGRNVQFVPEEEPEVSDILLRELGEHMKIYANVEVKEAKASPKGKVLMAEDRRTGEQISVTANEILVAAGRGTTSAILHPEKGGVDIDEKGWIKVDEYIQTSMPGVWAMGDADGRFMFKHLANYESEVVYHNAVLGRKVKADCHAVPHAVFTYPEAAGVGMKESEAIQKLGKENLAIGFYRYEDTAKGEAMAAKDFFVKIILEKRNDRIVGAHVVGPHESLRRSMHIHPALNEVVQMALYSV